MANDIRLNFGHVAFPYTAEEALVESASYRPDNRVENIKASLAELRKYFDKHMPRVVKNNEDDAIDAALKMLQELKNSCDQDESAQKHVK